MKILPAETSVFKGTGQRSAVTANDGTLQKIIHFMRFKVTLLLIFAITLSGFNLFGQDDHLLPGNNIFGVYEFEFGYYSEVRKVLYNNLSDDTEIRFFVLPSIGSERILMIEHDKKTEKYYLVYRIAHESIWRIYYDTKAGKKIPKISVDTWRVEIDKENVELIKSLFIAAVKETKYPKEEIPGVDGANFYFQVNTGWFGQKEGNIWSPEEGTLMNDLVTIGFSLMEIPIKTNGMVFIDSDLSNRILSLKEKIENQSIK
jgi:hypothetical protein